MCFRKLSMQISAATTEKFRSIYSRSRHKKGVCTHVLMAGKESIIISELSWCVAEKNTMQISAVITEKSISLHMLLNRPIFANDN